MTFREPIGVCGLIVPWNFPIAITSWKIAPALAMGNTVVVKPASQTPLTAFRIGELALEADFPPGVLNVISGPGSVVGEALVRHPLVRKISFTGSTEVGSQVMKLAADDVKRVTLELGGKSANIIFSDADQKQALYSAVWSVLGNAGQDCCARSRLLVEHSIYDKFLSQLTKLFEKVHLGDPLEEKTEMGPLISIIFSDADQKQALYSAVWSVLGNAGQDCCARSRLLVEHSIYDKFLSQLTKLFEKVHLGDPLEEKTEMGPLISTQHRERVCNYIELGIREGASLVTGGKVPEEKSLSHGAYLSPAIFTDIHTNMRIAQEEIFGPVLCVIPFDTEEEAITIANNTAYGLSGSIWTRDLERAIRVARAVETGALSINSAQSVHLEAPFGGFKKSGLGRGLGLGALDHYSELKSVFIHVGAS